MQVLAEGKGELFGWYDPDDAREWVLENKSRELKDKTMSAKEAVSKALGVGMRMIAPDGIRWREVEVIGDMRGKPLVRLHGRAAERADELNLKEWAVSLSHTREHAIAFAVAQ